MFDFNSVTKIENHQEIDIFACNLPLNVAEGISVEADDWNLPFTKSIINYAVSHKLIKLMAILK